MPKLSILVAAMLLSLLAADLPAQNIAAPPESFSTTPHEGSDWTELSNGCGDCQLGACCSPGVFGYAEWINWQTHRRGLDYAAFLNPIWLTPVGVDSLDYDRDNGLRTGIGYRFASCWDVSWNYAHFDTSAAGATSRTEQPNLELVSTRSFLDMIVDDVSAATSLDYDVHDIEAGRWVVWNPYIATRFFGGFRWAMIDQQTDQEYGYRDLLQNTVTSTIGEQIDMDAYGIRLGMETAWGGTSGLRLFGRAAGSVLLADFNVQQSEIDGVDGTIVNFSDSYTQAVPVLEAALGVAFSRDCWEVSGGYELNTWFNIAEVDRSSYDLIFDGFFLRASFSR